MENSLFTEFPSLAELWQLGWFRCGFTLAVGILLSIVTKRIFRPLNHRLPRQVGILIEKAVLAVLWIFIIVHALRAIGVDLISVLGAAGVAGLESIRRTVGMANNKDVTSIADPEKRARVEKIIITLGKNYIMNRESFTSGACYRKAMEEACLKKGVKFYHPSPILCTDNAAMIGAAAYYDFIAGKRAGLDLNAVPNLKLGD